jgi:hypothetical protein
MVISLLMTLTKAKAKVRVEFRLLVRRSVVVKSDEGE